MVKTTIYTILALILIATASAATYHSTYTIYDDFQTSTLGENISRNLWNVTTSNIADTFYTRTWAGSQAGNATPTGAWMYAIANTSNTSKHIAPSNWTISVQLMTQNTGNPIIGWGNPASIGSSPFVLLEYGTNLVQVYGADGLKVKAPYTLTLGKAYNLTINATNDQIMVKINGTLLADNTTTEITVPHKFYIYQDGAGSSTLYDNIRYTQITGNCSDSTLNGDETGTDWGGKCGTTLTNDTWTIYAVNQFGQPQENATLYFNRTLEYKHYTCQSPCQLSKMFFINSTNYTYILGYNATQYPTGQYNKTAINISPATQAFNITIPTAQYNITIINDLNQILTGIQINLSTNNTIQTTNPYQSWSTQYVNHTNITRNITIKLTDTLYLHQDTTTTILINLTSRYYNVTMERNRLTIEFNGYVNGTLTDSNITKRFNTTRLLIVPEELNTGPVQILFNNNTNNYTQFYEYMNTPTTILNENMTILAKTDSLQYFTTQDLAGAPIKQAQIRAYQYTPLTTYTYKQLIGQRLTDDSGKTLYILDSSKQAVLITTKEGYEINTKLINTDELNTDSTNPYTITLTPTSLTTTGYNAVYVPLKANTSKSITVTAYAPQATTVQMNTQYGIDNGVAWTDMTETDLKVYTATAQPGTHYPTGTNDTQNFLIKIDGTIAANRTLTNIDILTQENFLNWERTKIPSTLYNAYVIAIFIIILAFSSFIGIQMQNNTAGATSFLILSAIAAILDPRFLWITMIALISVIGTILYKNQQS